MRLKLPSYRFQIVLLVVLVVMIAVFLMRDIFLSNMQAYQMQVNELASEERVRELYIEYSAGLDSTSHVEFGHQIENILTDMHKISLAGEFYSRDIRLYTLGLVIFTILLALLIFFLAFGMITRPLGRLMSATDALGSGDFSIRVKENRFSPLNNLIMAFNGMITELMANRQRLIEAEKQTIWQEMARAMAHEIKNPLTPIRLSAERLEAKAAAGAEDLPQVLEKSLRVINEEVDNLQSLVASFSGFAKMPEARPQEYNLNTQIKEILDQYRSTATIDVQLDPRLETINADMMQIKQVLVNLVQNAIQACETDPHLLLRTTVEDDRCIIQVIDSGPGISAEHLQKIFEPYFTTKKKGTGLGLAICQRIIRQHGGEIQVASSLNEGTTFSITLPCQRTDASVGSPSTGADHNG